MKISELTQIEAARRDIKLPLSVAGQNMSITLGQIADALSQGAPRFGEFVEIPPSTAIAPGGDSLTVGKIVFDTTRKKFFLAIGRSISTSGMLQHVWSYYATWKYKDNYYDENGNVRTDAIFAREDGRLYIFDDTTLISAGITEQQAKALTHATPIQVSSEEVMEQRIAAGEYEDGQLYFVAEEE